MMAENVVLPGDRVSSAEEYEAGSNTFDDMGIIRADTIGTTNMDSATHMVSIKRAKLHPVAQPDDIVVGTVAAVLSSIIPVSIEYINGKKVTNGVECVCSTLPSMEFSIGSTAYSHSPFPIKSKAFENVGQEIVCAFLPKKLIAADSLYAPRSP